MNIEQHVPRLETCQKLQKAGWDKDTYFSSYNENTIFEVRRGKTYYEGVIPRPLLSELLEVIGDEVQIYKMGGDWVVKLYGSTKFYKVDNSAEAAAQLVLKLVEEGVLTL